MQQAKLEFNDGSVAVELIVEEVAISSKSTSLPGVGPCGEKVGCGVGGAGLPIVCARGASIGVGVGEDDCGYVSFWIFREVEARGGCSQETESRYRAEVASSTAWRV